MDRSFMQAHEFPGDGQADAAALVDHGARDLVLIEPVEDLLLLFFFHADPCVPDHELEQALFLYVLARQPVQLNHDQSLLGGELKGIGKKIEHDPFQLILVEERVQAFFGSMKRKIDVLFLGHIRKGKRKLFYEFYDVALAEAELQLLLFQLAEVQQLIHHVQETPGVPVNKLELSLPGGVVRVPDDLVHRSEDQRKGGTEFMADIGEEADLHHIELV